MKRIGCAVISKNIKERTLASVENPQCEIPCTNNTICMNTFSDKGATCLAIPKRPNQVFSLPFDTETEVICTHSSGSGSHSGINAFYALDLATDYNKPASIVRAAADGVVYVFMDEDGELCLEPSGTPAKSESSSCGLSWNDESVPFSFEATQDGKVKIFDTESVACAHAGIGNANSSEQPRFSGVK